MKKSRVLILAAGAALVAGLLVGVPRLAAADVQGDPITIHAFADSRCLDQFKNGRLDSPIVQDCDLSTGESWVPTVITSNNTLLLKNSGSQQCMIATDLGTIRMNSSCDTADPAFRWRQQAQPGGFTALVNDLFGTCLTRDDGSDSVRAQACTSPPFGNQLWFGRDL